MARRIRGTGAETTLLVYAERDIVVIIIIIAYSFVVTSVFGGSETEEEIESERERKGERGKNAKNKNSITLGGRAVGGDKRVSCTRSNCTDEKVNVCRGKKKKK